MRPARLGAFTIIELLVVILIIAVLIALLLPALAQVRKVTNRAVGSHHIRQLLLATQMYTMDYGGFLPRSSQDDFLLPNGDNANIRQKAAALWFNALDDYLGLIILEYKSSDPDARNYEKFKQDPAWINDIPPDLRRDNRTIKMNNVFAKQEIGTHIGSAFRHETEIFDPARTVVYFDGNAADIAPASGIGSGFNNDFGGPPMAVGMRHFGGANVGFADGHVKHWVQTLRFTGTGVAGWHNEGTGLQALEWNLDPSD